VIRDRSEAAGLTMSPEFEEIWRRELRVSARNLSVARRRFREEAKGDEGGRRGGLYRPGRVTEGAGE
jgi:hypothetical protein